ncbi:MAG: clostripain-related cysteine peptidase [Elusimicrobia bacterium]|nr:clostripain-related cysteine peptidase [Elusimicrobiota bacterium]
MKKILIPALLAVLAAAPALAQFDGTDLGVSKAAEVAVPEAADAKALPAAKAGLKEWTVMVYINGKNDLELAGLYNVNQMEQVGSSSKVNIVVEMGRMNGQAQGDAHQDGDWTGSRRYYITKDKDEEHIHSIKAGDAASVDMGDYKRVVDFVKWAKDMFPAKRYMLILWNHGSGFMDPRKERKGISFDDETGNYIRTPQIGQILREAGKVDVLAFDACLMQSAEVDYEVKDNVDVIVGSEETVPALGYPYSLFLGALVKKPAMDAEQLGAITVEAYKMFYDKMGKAAQLSAVRASKLEGFAQRMKDFSALAKDSDAAALKAARDGVIRYDAVGPSDAKMTISFYGDAAQFAKLAADNLKESDKSAAIKQKAEELGAFIDGELVIYKGASGKNRAGHEMSESRGISVYLPPAEARISQTRLEGIFEAPYTDFAFDKASGWHDFVTMLYDTAIAPAPVVAPVTAAAPGQ